MQKRSNTVIFMIGATALNMVLIVGIFLVALFLLGRLFPPGDSPQAQGTLLLVSAGAGLIGGFFAYRYIIKWAQRRFDIDQYMGPLFGPRRPPGA
tara:strand:+ start:163 stop:447 length:285 start_codon:yes stop_codon:yes gene_type:complete